MAESRSFEAEKNVVPIKVKFHHANIKLKNSGLSCEKFRAYPVPPPPAKKVISPINYSEKNLTSLLLFENFFAMINAEMSQINSCHLMSELCQYKEVNFVNCSGRLRDHCSRSFISYTIDGRMMIILKTILFEFLVFSIDIQGKLRSISELYQST